MLRMAPTSILQISHLTISINPNPELLNQFQILLEFLNLFLSINLYRINEELNHNDNNDNNNTITQLKLQKYIPPPNPKQVKPKIWELPNRKNFSNWVINTFQQYETGNKKYEGEWQNNKYHGNGTYYYENGIVMYEGELQNDNCHGNGTYSKKETNK